MKNQIIDLEEKYQQILFDIFNSTKIKNNLNGMETVVNNNYDDLTYRRHIENKIQIGFERILESNIYQEEFVKGMYYSPMSADIAFYTDDAIINIDAKTINCAPGTNPGDEHQVQFNRNQVSLTNVNVRSDVATGFEGIEYHSELPTIDSASGLPVLTFFLTLVYKDDGKSLSLERMNLVCVPNGIVSEEEYNSDLIHNTKSYDYITTKMAKKFEKHKLGKNLEPKSTTEGLIEKVNGFYEDPTAKHPLQLSGKVYRRKVDKAYKVILGVGTARITPDKITNRKNSKEDTWLGVIRWKI